MATTGALKADDKLLTANFLLVCFASLTFFSSMYLLLPTLPVYIQRVGGQESDIGLIIGVFTISSVIVRPFIGRSIDRRGRKVFLVSGAAIFLFSSVLYNLASNVPLLLLLRAFHGLGIASFTTASAALIADIAPIRRRGEAMGYYGMFSNVAMAAGPALGWAVVVGYDFTALFLVSAAFALTGLLFAMGVGEHSGSDARLAGQARAGLFSSRAFFPAVVIFGLTVTYGAINSFLPLYASKHGVANPGLFFTVFAGTLLVVRMFSGWASDRYGRPAVIGPGLGATAMAMFLLAFTASTWMFVLVGVVYGFGFASVQPTMLALVTDRVDAKERGAAMGTYTAAFDLGIGLGSIVLGLILQATSFPFMFAVAGLVNLLSLLYFGAGVLGLVDRQQAERKAN